jgi:hypothetical protein
VLGTLPDLPLEHDAATTARYIQSLMAGTRAMPASLLAQADCLLNALTALAPH